MITIIRDENGVRKCIDCNNIEDIVIEDLEKHLQDFHGWNRQAAEAYQEHVDDDNNKEPGRSWWYQK
jgi:hypothetical protein